MEATEETIETLKAKLAESEAKNLDLQKQANFVIQAVQRQRDAALAAQANAETALAMKG